ncbi:MAG: hypothetical protein WCK90_01235 [archaeon]
MIFDLEITQVPNAERLFLNILSRQAHSFGSLRAILDTGSPTTIISAADAIRLNIPANSLDSGDPIKGFGRGGIPSKKVRSFSLALKSRDNTIKRIDMPLSVVDINALRSMPQEFKENVYRIPTIIGLDFLKFSRMKLMVDLASNIAFLESQEEPVKQE